MLNYRTPKESVLAVQSLLAAGSPPREIILVDNASDDGTVAAVRAATDSASLALQAVETSVQHYVETRDYMRLKDMAEASAVAGQVL